MRHPILVVQDHKRARDGIVDALDKDGFVGIPAANGFEALEYLQCGGDATVILVDEPVGWSVFREAQQREPSIARIPVVAMSPLEGPSAVYAAPEGRRTPRVDVDTLLIIVRHLCEKAEHPHDPARG
jgi:CheY-like chemotaxis protein